MRTVGAVTGTRAEYGILLPVLRAVEASPRLRLRLFVTGVHLVKEFGETVDLIQEDGFEPAALISVSGYDTTQALTKGVGQIIQDLASPLEEEEVDLLLLLGDRGEMLAGAVAATYLRIPVAHIHGGERSGHVDDAVRNAITRLAHVHLAATDESANRLRRMGEESWRIHLVGAPRLDAILHGDRKERGEVRDALEMASDKPLILLLQHPTAKDRAQSGMLLRHSLEAALSFDAHVVAIYPNGDPGSLEMVELLREYADLHGFPLFKSLSEAEYLDLLSAASVLVGNSSSGIIEAPSLGVPVVNVGDRQEGRERGGNVLDVPYDEREIRDAIHRALHDHSFLQVVGKRENPYGDGHASERIVGILERLRIDDHLLEKRLTF